ncbi:hypothetical protein INT43_005456 [Umbelopsis isabellina]|uniref:Uncharacterized protein n=1 Tax=Mortierella isabellina TaxID=91625 RepID=A0A8H7PLH2_MORIS|nr:hypothetical protein INT43_005456 [Umbelopsis isabellina]
MTQSHLVNEILYLSPEMGFDGQAYSVYSINHEELKYEQQSNSNSSIIWEGHGLLSQIIDTDIRDEKEISGEVYPCNSQQHTFEVHVTINLKSVSKPTPAVSLEDTGKQPVLEAPYTNNVMNRQSSMLLSHFSNQSSPDTHTFNRELPRILSRRNSMEIRGSLPSFQQNHLRMIRRIEFFYSLLDDFDSEYSNYETHNEESSRTQRKSRTYATGQKRKAKGREPTSRYYYEMERDQNGQPILPVEIDSWTVLNLGVIDSDRPAFHTARYIYPIGYTIKKWYRSMVDAKRDTQYTCRIVDGGEEPRFQVIADDNRGTVFEGRTPTTVWTEVVRKAFAIRNLDYQHSPVGPEFFGLRKNAIAKMIQDLANANKCRKYVWQNFKPTMSGKAGRNRRRINNIGTSSPEPHEKQQPQNVVNLDKPVHS